MTEESKISSENDQGNLKMDNKTKNDQNHLEMDKMITKSDQTSSINISKSQINKKLHPGFCAKCGSYVGGFPKCHWCHSTMPHAPQLRLGRFLALMITIGGLILMGMYASIEPAPTVNIGALGPTFSNGNLIIEGEITNIDYFEPADRSWKSLRFTVTDSTGSIEVKAYTETINEMIQTQNTPALGEECSVRGSYYIRGEEQYILLDNCDYFITSREISFHLTSDELLNSYALSPNSYLGEWAQINGTITYIGTNGYYFDLDNSIRIYFPEYARAFSSDSTFTYIEGDVVSIEGIIHEYDNKPELHLARTGDINYISHGGESI